MCATVDHACGNSQRHVLGKSVVLWCTLDFRYIYWNIIIQEAYKVVLIHQEESASFKVSTRLSIDFTDRNKLVHTKSTEQLDHLWNHFTNMKGQSSCLKKDMSLPFVWKSLLTLIVYCKQTNNTKNIKWVKVTMSLSSPLLCQYVLGSMHWVATVKTSTVGNIPRNDS